MKVSEEGAAGQHRLIHCRGGTNLAVPVVHEFDEVLIADFSAIETAVTSRDDGSGGGHVGVGGWINRYCIRPRPPAVAARRYLTGTIPTWPAGA